MKIINPSFVTKPKVLQSIWNDQVDGFPAPTEVEKGSISSDGKFCWIYRGSHLLVSSIGDKSSSSYTLSRINFCEMLNCHNLQIVSVIECRDHLSFCDPNHNPYSLIVVLVKDQEDNTSSNLSSSSSSSIVVIYDSRLSKISKAIELPMKITAVDIISVSLSGRNLDIINHLPLELQFFHGIIAIGSQSGLVIFMDLNLDQDQDNDLCGSTPMISRLTYAVRFDSNSSFDFQAKRLTALTHRQHIGLPLNPDSLTKSHFNYKSCDGLQIVATFDSQNVFVNHLRYIAATNSLCVAFNFGGFQIYGLTNPNFNPNSNFPDSGPSSGLSSGLIPGSGFISGSGILGSSSGLIPGSSSYNLDVSCELEAGSTGALLPVISFNLLEPENDPKNLTWMWLIRGSNSELDLGFGSATAHLYCFGYKNKFWIPNFGFLYSAHESSKTWIDFVMTCNPLGTSPVRDQDEDDGDNSLSEEGSSSTFISCQVLQLGNKWAIKSEDGDDVLIDKSLFTFSWESSFGGKSSSSTFLALFDLNQFYNSQLPEKWVLNGPIDSSTSLCPYLAIFNLDQVKDNTSLSSSSSQNEDILNLRLDEDSFERYKSNILNHDVYFYPSSSSFEVKVLTESSVLDVKFDGLQKSALRTIYNVGPKVLLNPIESLRECFMAGLIGEEHFLTLKIEEQRQLLLTIMLQHDYLPFLIGVVTDWSSNVNSHLSMDSKNVLNWITNQLSTIKGQMDKISAPLFLDSDSQFDDEYAMKTLYPFEVDIKNLVLLLKHLKKVLEHKIETKNDSDLVQSIKQKIEAANCIGGYLRIMLWCVDCKLLPEIEEQDKTGRVLEHRPDEVIYPRSHFAAAYNVRRKKLKKLHPQVLRGTEVLLIDGLLEHCSNVSKHWKSISGSSMFPPSCIQVLISIYVLTNVSSDQKNMIMLYWLLEMASVLDQDKQKEICDKIKLFPSSFNLKPSLTKFVQAIWGLDQQLIDFAMDGFLDPQVIKEFFNVSNDDQSRTFKNSMFKRIILSLILQGHKSKAIKLTSICKSMPSMADIVDEFQLKNFVENSNSSSNPVTNVLEETDVTMVTPPRVSKVSKSGDIVLEPAKKQVEPPRSCLKAPRPQKADIPELLIQDVEMAEESGSQVEHGSQSSEPSSIVSKKVVQIVETETGDRMLTPSPLPDSDSISNYSDSVSEVSNLAEGENVSEKKPRGRGRKPRSAKKQPQVSSEEKVASSSNPEPETPTHSMKLRQKKNSQD